MAFFRQRGKGLWALSLALLCVVATASDLAEGPISLNVQQLDTAQPVAPPRPPNYARHARFMRMATSQAASTSSAAPNLNNMHITNAAPLIGPQGNFAGDVASQPAPLPVISPAADLIPPRTSTAFVPSSAYSSQPFNSMSLQTAPGARVLAGSGCVCESDPCDTCEKSDVDKLEEALDKIKDTIVDRSQQLREENIWVRQVLDIIRHYQQKMSQVTDHSKQLKGDIRALFRLKQRYEDAVLRARLEAGRRKQMHNRDEAAFRDLRPSTMVASPVTGVQNPYRFRSLRRGGASAPSSSASSPSDEGNMFMPPTATAQASGLPPLDSVVAAFPPTPQQIENRADTVVSAQLPAQQVDKDTVVFGD